jgi:hypothetical protein
MLTDRFGNPMPTANDEGLSDALVYVSQPEGGLSGPPIEQFRLTPRPDGWELFVSRPGGKATIKRANLPDLIKNMVALMLSDQREIVGAQFEEFLRQRDAPSQNGFVPDEESS